MKFKYFKLSDFDCKETGENQMKIEFIERLDELREEYGAPLYPTSGYRSPRHSIEARKSKPGTHAKGYACDFAISSSSDRYRLLQAAFKLGFTGIAYSKNFVHVDDRCRYEDTVPRTWNY